MKRTLTITMAVALIGSLMFMGFAGTAAAQNNNNVDNGISVDVDADFAEQEQTAETNIDIQQETQNEQVGEATAETNVLAADFGGAGTMAAPTAAPADKKGAAPAVAPAAADGGATALGVSEASVDQTQDLDQSNTVEISDVTTETGDNIQDASVDVTVDNNNNNNNNND
ncbi:hypothetical protein [Natrarchaeobaculum sulfurireducens]|nr:hypothetical protein [Natrarchaeobaculum sulfurireducens]